MYNNGMVEEQTFRIIFWSVLSVFFLVHFFRVKFGKIDDSIRKVSKRIGKANIKSQDILRDIEKLKKCIKKLDHGLYDANWKKDDVRGFMCGTMSLSELEKLEEDLKNRN
jgi:hypothetical protein